MRMAVTEWLPGKSRWVIPTARFSRWRLWYRCHLGDVFQKIPVAHRDGRMALSPICCGLRDAGAGLTLRLGGFAGRGSAADDWRGEGG